MRQPLAITLITTALLAIATAHASAHVTYTGRDFGLFPADGLEAPVPISISNLSGNFGWADATDADFGDSHRTRAFRFTLLNPAQVTLSIQGAAVGGASALPFPAFSLYRGLAHLAPDVGDHDSSAHSVWYLNSIGGGKEGSLDALADWFIGNLEGDISGYTDAQLFAGLSHFVYLGHAADGTSANYGVAAGVMGDGVPDGSVTATFDLPAGDYSVFVGGADYGASIAATAPYTGYGLTATLNVVPEPSTAALLGLSALGWMARRRRVSTPSGAVPARRGRVQAKRETFSSGQF